MTREDVRLEPRSTIYCRQSETDGYCNSVYDSYSQLCEITRFDRTQTAQQRSIETYHLHHLFMQRLNYWLKIANIFNIRLVYT